MMTLFFNIQGVSKMYVINFDACTHEDKINTKGLYKHDMWWNVQEQNSFLIKKGLSQK